MCIAICPVKSIGYYRPQRSCEGYVFTPVCHSVHRGGGCLSACWDTTTCPPEQTHTPRAGPQEQAPPRADTPPDQAPPLRSRHPPEQAPPQQTPPWDQAPPPPADGYCCGRYASYRNALLFGGENVSEFDSHNLAYGVHTQHQYLQLKK